MPAAADTTPDLNGKSVQELQAIAARAAIAPRAQAKRPLSRAAQLHLIDQLSRWGGSGLALIAGLSIFIAMAPARNLPIRTSIWAAMIFAALYLCRRYRKEFRRGDQISSHPFRWRAYYGSTLTVVSAAFGAGAFLVPPGAGPGPASMEIISIILLGAAGGALFNAAHRASAIAAGLPAAVASIVASFQLFGMGLFTAAILVGCAASAVGVACVTRQAERSAASRFPRTTFLRREVERPASHSSASAAPERAAG